MGKYILLYNTARMNYSGNEEVEIAKVVDSETEEEIFYVDYDKNLYRKSGYHICIDIYKNDGDGEFAVAKVDDLHRECLFEQPKVFLSMMLHEYGHYINGDLTPRDGITTESIKQDRERCIAEGRVMDMELKADAFAISHVGKNTFMRSMDYMIKKRKERRDIGMELAIREFELRKKAAQKIR